MSSIDYLMGQLLMSNQAVIARTHTQTHTHELCVCQLLQRRLGSVAVSQSVLRVCKRAPAIVSVCTF